MKRQYVYLMRNLATNPYLKIGETHEQHPQERADQLNCELIDFVEVANSRKEEKSLHGIYDFFRVDSAKIKELGVTDGTTEYFDITEKEGRYMLKTISGEHVCEPVSPFAIRFLDQTKDMQPLEIEISLLNGEAQLGRGIDVKKAHVDALAEKISQTGKIAKPLIISSDRTVLSGNHRFAAAKKLKMKTVPVIRAEAMHFNSKDLQDIAEAANKDNNPEKEVENDDLRSLLFKHANILSDFKGICLLEAYQEVYACAEDFAFKYGRSIQGVRRSITITADKLRKNEAAKDAGYFLVTSDNKKKILDELLKDVPEETHAHLATTKNEQQALGFCLSNMRKKGKTSGIIYLAAEEEALDKSDEERISQLQANVDFIVKHGFELDIKVVALDQSRKF